MYEANDIKNGLYGKLYDENGQQLQSTQEFEFGAEYNKVAKKIPGVFFESHKVTGGTLAGKMKMDDIDDRLKKKVAENPTGKYNYIGKLVDPDAKGNTGVLIKGLSFNGTKLLAFVLGELGEQELEFTADGFSFTDVTE